MKPIPESVRAELAALADMSDEDIDLSDIPATTHEDWLGAVRGKFYGPIKRQLTVRVDADVLAWLKQDGDKGYQKRLNAVLRDSILNANKTYPSFTATHAFTAIRSAWRRSKSQPNSASLAAAAPASRR